MSSSSMLLKVQYFQPLKVPRHHNFIELCENNVVAHDTERVKPKKQRV